MYDFFLYNFVSCTLSNIKIWSVGRIKIVRFIGVQFSSITAYPPTDTQIKVYKKSMNVIYLSHRHTVQSVWQSGQSTPLSFSEEDTSCPF